MRKDELAKSDPRYRYTAEEKAQMFGLRCPPEEDQARQEFKDECDTKVILGRFGVNAHFGPTVSGAVDYTVDFRVVADAQVEAKQAFDRLPIKYRRGFANWRELAEAIERGEVDPPPKPAGDKPPSASAGGSGEAGGGPPSDSAGEGVPKVAPPPEKVAEKPV